MKKSTKTVKECLENAWTGKTDTFKNKFVKAIAEC